LITSITPANNTLTNMPPATITINYTEATSGLSLSTTTHSIKNSSNAEVTGACP
jgi:hypothetical protein